MSGSGAGQGTGAGASVATDGGLDSAIKLPRGGVMINTPIGPVQFGIPPETIKDHMIAGRTIPTHYVVPMEPFKRQIGPGQGMNVAEFEFPCYFNFFVKKQRVNLIVPSKEVELRIRNVLQETLFGPKAPDVSKDYSPRVPADKRANLAAEMKHFRHFGDTYMEMDMLVSFTHFDEGGVATINGVVDGERQQVYILRVGSYYVVEDSRRRKLGSAPDDVELPVPKSRRLADVPQFRPPLFGVTVLGSSHGFDPTEANSGYVVWVNRRGIMVDPPTNSTVVLRQQGIPSSLIEAVIVTHCHADHDAGTFQKILRENRVTLITTPTIKGGFVRKYAALSGLDPDFLRGVFAFRPVTIGTPMRLRGAIFEFFYSLHAIPCIGFKATYAGKSIAFSGDHLNDPAQLVKLRDKGVLSEGRCHELLNFPWECDVIMHEAGVPPIHTPISTLAALPDDVKERLLVVHSAAKDVPSGVGLKRAKSGVKHTIVLDVEPSLDEKVVEALDLVCNIDMLTGLSLRHAREVLEFTQREKFAKGSHIITKGDVGDAMYVIARGVAEVRVSRGNRQNLLSPPTSPTSPTSELEEEFGGATGESEFSIVKHFQVGDYFGEVALISGGVRTSDIVAVTDVTVLKIPRDSFHWMVEGSDVIARMRHLAEMRKNDAWAVINANSVLRKLTSGQKTQLEEYVHRRVYLEGEYIWRANEPTLSGILVGHGSVRFDRVVPQNSTQLSKAPVAGHRAAQQPAPVELGHGSFICDVNSLLNEGRTSCGLIAANRCVVLELDHEDLMRFFSRNPGVLLCVLHTNYVV